MSLKNNIEIFQKILNGFNGPFKISITDKNKKQEVKDDEFQRCKTQLWQRMEFLAMGLRRCGLEGIPLTTPELI